MVHPATGQRDAGLGGMEDAVPQRRDGLCGADRLQAQARCHHGFCLSSSGLELELQCRWLRMDVAAAGHIAADAQPTMRFLQGWSPQHPNFCSLFKRFLPAPSLLYPLRSFLHMAPGGPRDPADLLWGLSMSIWHLLRYEASSPITWEGLGTCPMAAAITDTGRELWAATPYKRKET